MAEGSARWRLGLRERLLAITLLVAVVAIVLTAWAVNRQTESELRGALRTEINKPQQVYNFYVLLAQERPATWADRLELAETAVQVASQYEVRVRLEDAVDGGLIWDTASREVGEDPGRPAAVAITLPAPDQDLLIDQAAEEVYRDCLVEAGIPVERNQDPTGVERFEPEGPAGLAGATSQAVTTCNNRKVAVADAARPTDAEGRPLYVGDLLLYVVNPKLDSTSTIGDSFNTQLVLTVLGVVLLAVLTTTLGARHLLRPITRLTRASRRMAGGHLDERVPDDRGDELGDLSRAFNSMASSLEVADGQRRRMTTDIAHELRTPLSNIRGYLEAAQDGVAPITPALIDSLHEDALLLQTLVDDLQELTVAESGGLALHRSPTDLDELAESVVAAHQPRARAAGIVVEVDASARTEAEVDQRRARQVLTNLVENGLRHTPAGGMITVRCRRDGTDAVLEVADTGRGIAPEHLPHLFERFYRADASRNRSTGGTGLGLAITRELVHAHGGTIGVASEVDVGTTFTVRLPLGPGSPASPPAAPPASPPAGPLPSPPSGGGTGPTPGTPTTTASPPLAEAPRTTARGQDGRDYDHVHVS
ncbi:MAG: HAMP domain-containing protein [Acidimicrobiia bacterium]|nr:HAMP domain-containing protein [Acidimicrobiia bacterium]